MDCLDGEQTLGEAGFRYQKVNFYFDFSNSRFSSEQKNAERECRVSGLAILIAVTKKQSFKVGFLKKNYHRNYSREKRYRPSSNLTGGRF